MIQRRQKDMVQEENSGGKKDLSAYMSDAFLLLWQEVTYSAANTAQSLFSPRRRGNFSLSFIL